MVTTVYAPEYALYDFGPAHPFTPLRQQMLLGLLEALGRAPACAAPAPATREEVLTAHDEAYVAAVEAASDGPARGQGGRFGLGTLDVPVMPHMDFAARTLAGGTLHGARLISEGAARRVLQLGGGLHHAQRAHASGFCVYNDLSMAIRRFEQQKMRVAYIDIDVHHGDGVQALHYADPNALTISLHEAGQYLFPGTGHVHELGEGDGLGFKLNAPLEPSTTGESYLEVFERVVPHALAWFAPDVLVVVCGADAHYRDPLADLLLTTHDFERLFRRLVELADRYAQGRALFTLAGGYDLDASTRIWALLYHVLAEKPLPDALPEDWRAEWSARLGRPLSARLHDAAPDLRPPDHEAIANQNRFSSRRLLEMAVRYWL